MYTKHQPGSSKSWPHDADRPATNLQSLESRFSRKRRRVPPSTWSFAHRGAPIPRDGRSNGRPIALTRTPLCRALGTAPQGANTRPSASSNKCHATSNKCIASSNKCLTSSNKKLVEIMVSTSFLLLVVRHLLLEAMHRGQTAIPVTASCYVRSKNAP